MTAKDMHSDAHNRLLTDDDRGAIEECLAEHNDAWWWQQVDHLAPVVESIVREHVSAALTREADHIAERIRAHGAGMPHGCDTGASNRCEAWGQDEAMLRAAARRAGGEG
ncbi:hypothetical protein ACIRON_02915 [Nocardioides sp. NPDC101246]|uniref:hypothetical protein n=1 Tax=Nocardioides sp. NPDC101246 TaxID=3364336 RepID=UPI00380C70FE